MSQMPAFFNIAMIMPFFLTFSVFEELYVCFNIFSSSVNII